METFHLFRLSALILAVVLSGGLVHAAPGDLDPTFNGTGTVTTTVGAGSTARSVAVQSDGKIVAAGYSLIGNNSFGVARYNANGTLDTTFNGSGTLITPIGSSDAEAWSVALQSDGKIVVAGFAFNGFANEFALARYNVNGTLDASFNGTGTVTTGAASGDAYGFGVTVQSDGKIVAAGSVFNGINNEFALARYNVNGSLDASFNGTGTVSTDFGGSDASGYSVAVQSDGKIVVAGSASDGITNEFAVARYNVNGSLDTSFNGTGTVTTSMGSSGASGFSVAVQSDGKIVVAGSAFNGITNEFALARYNVNGSLDASFNGTGKLTTGFAGGDAVGNSVALQSDGRILVAGVATSFGTGEDFAVARYNSNGTLDTTFGAGGRVTTAIGNTDDVGFSVAVQSDGKIVVAGGSSNGASVDFAVVRYQNQIASASNDNFADAQTLSGANGSTTGRNTQATFEPGEPNHLLNGSHSVWYRWTVPISGLAAVDLSGSSFDTVLAVYTGTALNGLTLVAADDDSGEAVTSRVVFEAIAGTTYHIAVDGFGTNTGDIALTYEAGVRVEPPTTDEPGTLTDTGFAIQSLTPTFTWSAVAGATRYGLFISRAPYGAADLVYSNTNLTGTAFQLPAGILADRTKYRWLMNSFDATGAESATGSFLRFFETNTLGPGIFTIFNDPPVWDANAPAGPAVQVHWTASINATAYDLYRDGALYQAGLNVVNFYDKTGLSSGVTYTYFVIARNAAGNGQSEAIEVGPMPFAPLPGTNDNFADAQPLNGASGSTTGRNPQATLQPGEPNHLGSGSHSVWYRWTVPTSGLAAVDLRGSSFDTVLAVYTGTSLNGLTLVAEDDDSAEDRTSRVEFEAIAGTIYHIAVDGYISATGDIALTYEAGVGLQPPTTIGPGTLTDTGFSVQSLTPTFTWSTAAGATRYGLFVSRAPYGGENLVYSNTNLTGTAFQIPAGILVDGTKYRWQMTSFDAAGAESATGSLLRYFETNTQGLPGIFTVFNDPPVWDGNAPAGPAVQLSWTASSSATAYDLYRNGALYQAGLNVLNFYDKTGLNSGEIYSYVVIARNAAGSRQSEAIEVGPMPFAPVPGTNDNFADAQPLNGAFGFAIGRNPQATLEPGEPNHLGSGSHSVWYRWTVPISGLAAVDLSGSNFDTVLSVYTGTALNGLTLVAENDESEEGFTSRVVFQAIAGTTYHIAVDGFGTDTGDIVLTYEAGVRVEPPTTDEPGTLTDTGFAIQSLTPTFTWNAVAGAARYGLFISRAPYGDADLVYSNTNLTGTAFQIPAGILVDRTKYRWIMNSFDATGAESATGSFFRFFETNTQGPGTFTVSNDPPVWDANAPAGPAVQVHWTASINATAYDLYRDGALYQAGLNVLSFYDKTGLNSGEVYTYAVIARNAAGSRQSEAIEVGPMPFAPVPGTNDNFADAQPLNGANGSTTGRNTQATFEPGEPNHLLSGSHSVWYRWTVPTSGLAVVDLRGSNFDTVLAVYTGTLLNNLTLVAENDQSEDDDTSRVEFEATAGTTYHIAVDGFITDTGDIALTYEAGVRVGPPTTDEPGTLTDSGFAIQSLTPTFTWSAVAGATRYGLFISRAPYGSANLVYSNTNLTGTSFQIPAGILVDGTKYRWQMTSFDATGAESTNSLLRYFETNTRGPDTFTVSNDPPVWDASAPAGPAVQLHWTESINATAYDLYRNGALYQAGLNVTSFYDKTGLTSGENYTYYVVARNAAGSRQSEAIEVGPMPFAPLPGINDNFADAQPLSGANGSTTGRNTQATFEPGEPNHLGSGSHSVWYRWTVPTSGLAVVDLRGSSFDTVLAVYTGPSLNNLTLLAENDDSEEGFSSRVVFEAISGTTYHIAVDGFFTATGEIVLNYAGEVGPAATTGAPTNVTSTGANLIGTVNPNGSATTAFFEYGLTTAYGSSTPERPVGSGSSGVLLSQPLSGLEPGTTYHFRVVASSSGGPPTFGTDVTFSTPSAASTTLQFSNASYSVDENANVTVTVTKSGDLAAEVRVTTADGVALAGDYIPLAETLQFAAQDTTKQITILITDDALPEPDEGFTVTLSNATNGAAILNGTATVTIVDNDAAAKPPQFLRPDAPPSAKGALEVTLINTPQPARWRLQGETIWRESGAAGIASALTEGEYVVEFEPLGGPVPPPQTVVITGQGTQRMTVDYAVALPSGSGTLTVNLEPPEVADPARVVSPEFRARWRFLGEGDNAWRNTGVTLEALRAGTYVLEFSSVAGRAKVPNLGVFIEPDVTRTVTALYQRTTNPVGAAPEPLTFGQVTSEEPFVYCGQVQTDTGFGSGVVVKERVVLTAGHIVFDDAKLTFGTAPIDDSNLSDFVATGIRWRFQRMQRELEPVPLVARGAYVLTGYAGARRAQQTQQARERDAAALYFFERAGRGGFAEPLVTNAADEWLLKPGRKTLAGYPIDEERIAEADRGRLHAVPNAPGVVPFTRGTGGGRIYRTNAIHGLPGCSGGPVFVEGEEGNFYPAGIYLGGNEEALVRAIDAEVVSVIALAERSSSDGGENHTSGGIVRVSSGRSVASFTIGRVRVNLGPSGAVNAGAKWRLSTESNSALRNSGIQAPLPTGRYTVVFNDVPGFVKPAALNFNIQDDQGIVLEGAYQPLTAPRITSGASSPGSRNQPFTYQIETSPRVDNFSITGALPSGLVFNTGSGLISGIPEQSGRFPVTISVSNAAGSDTLALIIRIAPVLVNQVAAGSLGRNFNYKITVTDLVNSYAADQLAALGLSLNVTTGVISGVPTQAGVFNIPISITNDGGTATALLALNVRENELAGVIGQPFSFQVTSPNAASFSASDLPPGLSIDPQSGLISGTPTASGSFVASIQVTSQSGSSAIELAFVIDAVLRVTVSGSGQITDGFAGDSFRLPGEALSITATPASGRFFAGWTGGEESRELTLDFAMRDGLELQANFVPFATVKGRYRGLIASTPADPGAGKMTITVSRTGAFTGSMKFAGKKHRLRGIFDGSGSFTKSIFPKRTPPLEVQLRLEALGAQQRITGTLTVAGEAHAISADRKISNKRTSRAGRYALVLTDDSADQNEPASLHREGFAVIVVSTTGEARVTGTLGDGTAFAAGASLSENGSLPLHVDLAGDRALTGVLAFSSEQPLESVTGTLHWVTPDVASRREITALGSRIFDQ